MIEVIIDGYFTESQCKRIKEKMQGKTFFDFEISYSNFAGNCRLIIRSDNETHTADELKSMFIYSCISELGRG